METEEGDLVTSSDFQSESEDLASQIMQPIDLTNLIAQGLLQKEGMCYRFTNIHAPPPHVTDHIVDIQIVPGTPSGLVKFRLSSKDA